MDIFFRRIPSDTKPYELFLFVVEGLQDGISSQEGAGSNINNIDILVQKDSELKTVWHHGMITIGNNKIAQSSISNLNNTVFKGWPIHVREFVNRHPKSDRRKHLLEIKPVSNRRLAERRNHKLEVVTDLGL